MYVPHARKNKSYCFWNRVYSCGPAVTLVKRHDKKFNDVIALSKQRWRHTRAQPLAYRASKCTQHDAFVLVICARVSRTFWPVVYGKLYPTLCSNIEMFPGKMSFSRPVDIYVDSVLQCIHRENNGNSSFLFYRRISNASISYEEIIEINKNVIFNILNIIFFKYINSYCCTSLTSNRS